MRGENSTVLTKDLLRLRRQGDELRPQWLKGDGKEGAFVAELVALFRGCLGQSQGEVRAQALELAGTHSVPPLLARGLLKVCFDAATTEEKADRNYADLRKSLFLAAARRLSQPDAVPLSPAGLREEVAKSLLSGAHPSSEGKQEAYAFLQEANLYADLPDESPLTAFPFEDAASLLLRYNVSLAQSLLVNARQVLLTLPQGDRALLRRLWKALRFHGLIARLRPTAAGCVEVELEGPLSLHVQAMKYGFSLAAFLPSLLCEQRWRLEAQVSLQPLEASVFRLEPRPELKTLRRAFHQYTPPELSLVFRSLAAKAEALGWAVQECEDFVDLPGEVACFPDFRLVDPQGRGVDLEVFHPWHVAALRARAEQLRRSPDTPLLLAVSRKTAKATGSEVLDALESEAPGHLVAYRETPLADDIFVAASKLNAQAKQAPAVRTI
jgi:predicted nuclease of restriction endonuclease-like RecB superfamily